MVEVQTTPFAGLLVIKPRLIGDSRGYFIETFNQRDFLNAGIDNIFVQDNQSFSKYGTLRGLHFQKGEYAQAKLIRVLKGKILDVVVDLRPNSKTFKKKFSYELEDQNHEQLLVPRGFAHGFIVLSDEALVSYKCDNYYAAQFEGGIQSADPELHIDWQVPPDKRILSAKDQKLPLFAEVLSHRLWEM